VVGAVAFLLRRLGLSAVQPCSHHAQGGQVNGVNLNFYGGWLLT
jgi:hypothetical protein